MATQPLDCRAERDFGESIRLKGLQLERAIALETALPEGMPILTALVNSMEEDLQADYLMRAAGTDDGALSGDVTKTPMQTDRRTRQIAGMTSSVQTQKETTAIVQRLATGSRVREAAAEWLAWATVGARKLSQAEKWQRIQLYAEQDPAAAQLILRFCFPNMEVSEEKERLKLLDKILARRRIFARTWSLEDLDAEMEQARKFWEKHVKLEQELGREVDMGLEAKIVVRYQPDGRALILQVFPEAPTASFDDDESVESEDDSVSSQRLEQVRE